MNEQPQKEDQQIDVNFFDAGFHTHSGKQYKHISGEQSKQIIFEALDFHEDVYLPAEKKEEERIGRPLVYGEQMSLLLHLKYDEK